MCGVEQQRQLEACSNKSPANKHQLTCDDAVMMMFYVVLLLLDFCCFLF